MVAFPTMEWLDENVKVLNESEEFGKAGKGWGVDFNGNFIFQINDLPLETLQKVEEMVGEGEEENLTKIAENLGVSIEEGMELIQKLEGYIEEYVDGKTIYTFIGLKDGKCTGARLLKSPDEEEVGFKLIGSYDMWKKMIKGETDATKAVLTRKMMLEGKMSTIMRYMKATQIMNKLSTEVPTEFVDEFIE